MAALTLKSSLAVFLLFASSAAAELAVNGGFETGDTSGWESFPTANSTFNITGDSNSGAFAAEVFNNDPGSSAVVKQANVGVGVVQPGEEILISFAAKGEGAIGGVAFAEFFSELDGGGVSAGEILSGAPLVLTDTYQTFEFSAITGPDVSGGVSLQFAAVTGADAGSVSVLFIDDVSITRAIPEPAAVLLVGAGCAAAFVRRRRA